ncbi:MAG TPA: glycosyltransferase [Nitrospiraceae bacterium]|jgi:glycosyltransferase involved in cell wall biosynthesis|nr:glycosyltransferase [Nitrospiraceae bacterium]
MRVLYIITGLATGGAEIMLLRLLERLDRGRYKPMVISLTTVGDIGPRIAALDIPVQALGMTSGLSGLSGFRRLLREVKRFEPDIVHTWLYHADLFGGLAARLAGIDAVCWSIRSSNLDSDKTHWTTRAVRQVGALLSHIIPRRIFLNSETASRIHVSLGYAVEKMSVVPNGFDMTRFRPNNAARSRMRASLGCGDDTLLVGMISRFDPLKNHYGFVSAMAVVHRQMPQVHFLLAGKGVDRDNEELMRWIEKAGLLENTHLLGSRDDVPELMAALDVLACPSHAEAFPNVVGEAMAVGVPCVATDVGDCASIIGDTGTVVPAGDMASFAAGVIGMLKLSREQRVALGEKARARVACHFEIGRIVRRYEELYEFLRVNGR